MMNRKIAGIIDYNSGNIRSVVNAVESIGVATQRVYDPDQLAGCSHIILPGVGAFGFCVDRLRESGLLPALENWALQDKKPLLGICVGMQLMADSSEEQGRHEGLGWIGGLVRKLDKSSDDGIRVPHVGWNEVVFSQSFGLFKSGEYVDFYFDHSFAYHNPVLGYEIGFCRHGCQFSAIVRRDNIVAVQFHPEKSQTAGMRLLESFLAL
jgi:imidazole glycerol-phosphate synthase subunit HisH